MCELRRVPLSSACSSLSIIVCSKPKYRGLNGKNIENDKRQHGSVAESKRLGIKLDNCLTWDNVWFTLKKSLSREATWPTEENDEISFAKSKNSAL